MNKYGPRYFKPEEIEFKGHWADGFEYSVPGSKDNVYEIKFTQKGLTCDCSGFTFRGKCKHTLAIAEKFYKEEENDT